MLKDWSFRPKSGARYNLNEELWKETGTQKMAMENFGFPTTCPVLGEQKSLLLRRVGGRH